MKKNFMSKFLISCLLNLIFLCNFLCAKELTFVSLSPALTETMYALGAEDLLKAVSTACSYPKEANQKEKIGNNFFINNEKILQLRPDYILALDSSEFAVNKFKQFGIKPLCFKYPDINSIHENILTLGKITGKITEAQILVNTSNKKIALANKHKGKKILYLVQSTPMISIGKKSFITDIIDKSGNISITKNIDAFYPTISEEFAIMQKPDVIVLSFHFDEKRIKKLFPNAKIYFMNTNENDIVNRPGPRIYKSVEFFSSL